MAVPPFCDNGAGYSCVRPWALLDPDGKGTKNTTTHVSAGVGNDDGRTSARRGNQRGFKPVV